MVPSMRSNTLAQLIADINGKGSQEKWIFEKAKETKSRTPGFWCFAMAEYKSFSWCSLETKS